MGTGEYRWVPVGTGGYRWPLVESKYYIVTNLDCYKLTDFQFTENSWPKNANWEEVLYEDSVKDLLKIC